MTPPEDLKACFQGAGRVALRFSEPPVTSTTQDHYEPGKLGTVMVLFLFASIIKQGTTIGKEHIESIDTNYFCVPFGVFVYNDKIEIYYRYTDKKDLMRKILIRSFAFMKRPKHGRTYKTVMTC